MDANLHRIPPWVGAEPGGAPGSRPAVRHWQRGRSPSAPYILRDGYAAETSQYSGQCREESADVTPLFITRPVYAVFRRNNHGEASLTKDRECPHASGFQVPNQADISIEYLAPYPTTPSGLWLSPNLPLLSVPPGRNLQNLPKVSRVPFTL